MSLTAELKVSESETGRTEIVISVPCSDRQCRMGRAEELNTLRRGLTRKGITATVLVETRERQRVVVITMDTGNMSKNPLDTIGSWLNSQLGLASRSVIRLPAEPVHLPKDVYAE